MSEENLKRLTYWMRTCFGLGGLIVVMLGVDTFVTRAQAVEAAHGQSFFLLITAFCITVIGFNLRQIIKDESK